MSWLLAPLLRRVVGGNDPSETPTEQIQPATVADDEPLTEADHVQTAARGRVDGQPGEGLLIRIEADLFEEGRKVARDSGRTTVDPEAISTLRDMADHAAARLSAAGYNPAGNVADELVETEYQKTLGEKESLKQQVDYARAAKRDRVSELAALGDAPQPPPPPVLAGVLGVLAIGLTVAPTLHDIMFATILRHSGQALVASVAAGAMLAGLLVWGILGRASHPDEVSHEG